MVIINKYNYWEENTPNFTKSIISSSEKNKIVLETKQNNNLTEISITMWTDRIVKS